MTDMYGSQELYESTGKFCVQTPNTPTRVDGRIASVVAQIVVRTVRIIIKTFCAPNIFVKNVYLILGCPEEDGLLALKEEGNMRATRWMAQKNPEYIKESSFVEPCSNLSKPFYKRICSFVFLVVAACM